MPPVWRRLIATLKDCGVTIAAANTEARAAKESDLAALHRFVAGSASESLRGDGSVAQFEADTTLMAAEALAEWLAAGSEDELGGTVVVCPEGDSALLDLVLQARGLPALGLSAPSPFRGALQVLSLAFACAFAPFDARALLNLLMLPRPPIGRRAAGRLIRALVSEPGIGGPRWTEAWSNIERDLSERFADRPPAEAKAEVEKRLARWSEWTRAAEYDRNAGMTAETARAIAARVAGRALQTDAGVGDSLLMALAGAASSLGAAIGALGQIRLPALLIERMISQVLADGSANPDHIATAGGLRGVRDPGAVWGEVSRVIWWGFTGPGERVPVSPWSEAEREALAAAGCVIETPEAITSRQTYRATLPLRCAGAQILFVRAAMAGAEETVSHPLAHLLHPLLHPAGEKIRLRAEALLGRETTYFARRAIRREPAALLSLPAPRAQWMLPAPAVARLATRKESASSFERMTACQFRWLVQDVLRLSRGRFAEIPNADQLIGSLAHALAERAFPPGPVAPDADIRATIEAAFEALVLEIAAPLLQPENAGELAAAREKAPAALSHLADFLRRRGIEVVGTEQTRDASFGAGFAVTGRIDLMVRDPRQGLGVIDLKWSHSARRRREELEQGRALQLATYGAIAEPGRSVPGAYYLLRQRRLIGPSGAFVAEEMADAPRELAQTWSDLLADWELWRKLAENGTALALGLPEALERLPENLAIAPGEDPCRYCELTSLCRVGEEALR